MLYFRNYDTGCPVGVPHIFPIGALLSVSTLYSGVPSHCNATSTSTGVSVYDASTTEIDPASFVAFTVTSQTQ